MVAETSVSLGAAQVVKLGTSTTLQLPETPARGAVTVRAVSGVVRRGATPAGDVVQIASRGVSFAPPVRMSQTVPPPPPGRSYVAVTSDDGNDAWVTKGAARAVVMATVADGVDGGATAGVATYEIDVTGSGLWAIAVADPEATCSITGASGCAANQTCTLACRDVTPVFSCQAAGTRKEGEVCSGGDCEPGTQCMRTACGVSVCNRLCRDDAACGGQRCLTVPITCATATTDVRVCARACDPTGAATTGCPTGLRCVVFPNEIASCDCPAATRTKGDGAACANSDDCLPGLLCVAGAGGATVCRPLCTLGGSDCAAPRTCVMVREPTMTKWGACTP